MIKVLVFILCIFANIAQAKLFGAQEFYLDNGLQVVVVPNHKAPVVKLMLWYKVGSVDEPMGKGGLAHLLEHLMFRGTKKVKGSKFNDIINNHGGESNAFTSHDFTAYHEFMDISRLEVALALEADRMQNLDISDEAFSAERKIVFQERKQRVSNNPFARFGEVLEKTLWQNNPYSEPITGTEEEINSLTKEDAISFYNTYYSPDNAVLVLAGDIDVKTAKKVVKKYFAYISPKKQNLPKINFENVQNASFVLTQQSEEIKQERYINKYIIPSCFDNKEQTFALMLFSNYFGKTTNGYLQKNYVLTNKVLSAKAVYNWLRRGQGAFSITAIPNNDTSDIKELMDTALSEAINSFDEKALNDEKQKILSSLVYLQDNPQEAAYIVGQFSALGFSISDIENYDKYIENIKLEDVKRAVENMMNNSTNIRAFLKPLNPKGEADE